MIRRQDVSRAERAEQLIGSSADAERIARAQVLALLHIGDAINRLAEAVTSGRRSPVPISPNWRDAG